MSTRRMRGINCTNSTTPSTPKRYAIPYPAVMASALAPSTSFAAERPGVEVRPPVRSPTAMLASSLGSTTVRRTAVSAPTKITTTPITT